MKSKTTRFPLGIKCHCSKPSPTLKLESYETLDIKLHATESIKPLRIFVHGEKPEGLIITDVKCGNISQLDYRTRGISGRHFTEEKSQFMKLNTLGPDSCFCVSVRSVSEESIVFSIEIEAEVMNDDGTFG